VKDDISPFLVVLDNLAGHLLLNRKETSSAKGIQRYRHYLRTFLIVAQTKTYVTKNNNGQAIDTFDRQ